MSKHIPILFSTPMVQAILEGRKTQTRRVVKPQLNQHLHLNRDYVAEYWEGELVKCPYGQPGDVLWVRETWCLTQPYHPDAYYFGYKQGDHSENEAPEKYDFSTPDVWKPGIHMPKAACRIFLKVISVRVERLQDISEQDAIAEGIERSYSVNRSPGIEYKNYFPLNKGGEGFATASWSFESLWQTIHAGKPSSWENNPWVWVVEFERCQKPDGWDE